MKVEASKPPARAPEGPRNHTSTLTRSLPVYAVASILAVSIPGVASRRLLPPDIKAAVYHLAVRRGFAAFDDKTRLRDAAAHLPAYLSRLLTANDLPTIAIDVKFKDMKKLEAKRGEALATGRLVTGPDDFVPARIRTANGTLKANVRLKGDGIDHVEGQTKWSMRVRLKGDDHLDGLRRFSLQHPFTRGFQAEVLFKKTLEDNGILTPRYFFLNVIVNGTDWGIMALEEHFSKELLERSGRKDDVIIKLDESVFWAVKTPGTETPFLVDPFLLYQNATVGAFQSSRIRKSPGLRRDYGVAVGLMRGFTRGALGASEVFDAQLLGRYLGIVEFWGAWHEIRWENLRFYYNPFTMRLEPVAFDASLQFRLPVDRGIIGEPIVRKMLSDPQVHAVYAATLRRLDAQVLHGHLIQDYTKLERPILQNLQSEFFLLESFNFRDLRDRAASDVEKAGADGWIQPHGDFRQIPIFAHAQFVEDDADPYLELLNALPVEVEVRSIAWVDAAGNRSGFTPLVPTVYPFRLPPTPIGGTPAAVDIPYASRTSESPASLVVTFGIPGYEKPKEIREYTATRTYGPLRVNPMPASTIAEQLQTHRFLSLGADGTSVVAKTGTFQVRGCIVIPRGYTLTLEAGTTLQFQPSGCLVSFGTTFFRGEASAPVVLEALPGGDGKLGSWQGIVVHGAPSRSQWRHVTVRNTSGVSRGAWTMTGGTTFYRSDVDMWQATFTGHTGEDALNIIHSDFTLTDPRISNTASDGLDTDFSTGSITGGSFTDVGLKGGGDGIDISGSRVFTEDTSFLRVNDKAISVGERSTLGARNIVIRDCGVGVASKDGSKVTIHSSTIRHAEYAGLMAYTKKPEYGPARLNADQVAILQSQTPVLSQLGSVLRLNGERVPDRPVDVEALYETVMKPGVAR